MRAQPTISDAAQQPTIATTINGPASDISDRRRRATGFHARQMIRMTVRLRRARPPG
jgi:hypothetical protein